MDESQVFDFSSAIKFHGKIFSGWEASGTCI